MIHSSTIEAAQRAATNPQLLKTAGQLRAAAQEWSNHSVLGIDTEFLRERTFRAELGLVQVSDGLTAWLIDTITLDDPQPLRELFENPLILKVFHSASEDLEVLWNTLGVTPRPMVDTQIACAMLGQPLQLSYHHLVKWMTGIEVDKEQTRSNWIRRPLKPEQLHYAAMDVVFLPAILQELRSQLVERGRWRWLEEDVDRMIENSTQGPDYERAYLRIKGSDYLDEPSLHVLKALAAWREKTADEQNLARGFVLPDPALLQLANQKPESIDKMQGLQGVHPNALKKYQATLVNIIEQSRTADGPIEQALPMTRQQKQLIESMRNVVQREAKSLDSDPALLAAKKQLEALIRAHESGSPMPERFSGWRESIITDKLLNLARASIPD